MSLSLLGITNDQLASSSYRTRIKQLQQEVRLYIHVYINFKSSKSDMTLDMNNSLTLQQKPLLKTSYLSYSSVALLKKNPENSSSLLTSLNAREKRYDARVVAVVQTVINETELPLPVARGSRHSALLYTDYAVVTSVTVYISSATMERAFVAMASNSKVETHNKQQNW